VRYEARAPLRIDFAGGWTDVPIFAETEGGAVLNAAITRYARGFISRPEGNGVLRALRSDRSYVSYSLDVPAGAGLGASAAQNVLWATLVRTAIENTATRIDIAEMAAQIAGVLGILGGKQDEYASALGGFNYLSFTDSVTAERLSLEPPIADALRARLLLVYSGQSRISGGVHNLVWQRYRADESGVRSVLSRLARIAGEMRSALLAHDLEAFGGLIHENWEKQKELHPAINTSAIEDLIGRGLKAGAQAAKACGAGGGGCILFFAREGETERLRSAVESRRSPVIDFDFDAYGVHLRKA